MIKRSITAVLAIILIGTGGLGAGVVRAQEAYPPDDVAATSVIDVVADLVATNPAVRAAVEAFDNLDLATASPEELQEILDALLEALQDALPDLELQAIAPMLVTVDEDGNLSEVTPALILVKDPETGEIAVVTVGAGYAPGSPVTISVESTPIELGEVNATDKGKFIAIAQLPEGLTPGEHTLKASGKDDKGQDRVVAQPIKVENAKTEIDAERTSAVQDIAAAPTSSDDSGSGALVPLLLVGATFGLGAVAFVLMRRRPATS